ncbi:MATE family efflux transporter [Hyphomicrobium sp. DMF-1]|jgi:putative MATE family efflux protein|uniref:MATE family efflux transporter n=1 Tax=Hyphomicrobium sp. DMF-1 TaxID=3019544 RepID=UPI0022EBDA90|nr:MATE family efflux transporter [Hyphomicrobium sp. DMF-1]WBT39153.1 MATE family efflux transporter [Hyphomicrobium sp. DMF-1]
MNAPTKAEALPRAPAKFVVGSLLRHILVMSGAGGVGLGAIFLSDLANIAFLSLLDDQAVLAAVGYASSILFLMIGTGIGLSIASTTLVSRALGEGRRLRACRFSVNAHIANFVAGLAAAALIYFAIPWFLTLFGATGRTHDLAARYLYILVPSIPVLTLAMTSAAVLRSIGDARRAMNITLYGAIINTILDPIFIIVMGLGIEGAAWATVIARIVFMLVGLYGVIGVHGLVARPRLPALLVDIPAMASIAVPAILTNVATPVSNAYVTAAIATHGDDAVAGWAIIGRILPVAFGTIYALSSSIGPIIGQNYGAREGDRVRQAFRLALAVNGAFTLAAWIVLALLSAHLVRLFGATGDAAALINLFNYWLAPLFAFMGALFVANAVFNTLDFPHYATLLNWGRATLGTIPVVHLGSSLAGAEGALAGHMVGGILFGCLSVWLCRHLIEKLLSEPFRHI